MPALGDELDAERRIAELEQALRRTQGQLHKAKAKTSDLVAAVYEAARDAALVNGTPAPVTAPKRDKRKGSGEVALLHMTDVHVGAVTATYNT